MKDYIAVSKSRRDDVLQIRRRRDSLIGHAFRMKSLSCAVREDSMSIIAAPDIAGIRAPSVGRAYSRMTAAHGQRRNCVVVIASSCARAQRIGGVSSTERHDAGPAARGSQESDCSAGKTAKVWQV
jgi:hypothetical protein